MTNKFKTLLKTSAALVTLMAGQQSWGAGAWVDVLSGATVTGPEVPTAKSVSYHLTAGTSTTAALAVTPAAGSSAAKKMNVSMGLQSNAAPTNGLTFTPSSDCTIDLNCAGSNTEDYLKFILTGGSNNAVINLASGGYDFSGTGTGKVVVNILEDVNLRVAGVYALGWTYTIKKGTTLTISGAAPFTGKISGSGARIVTDSVASATIVLK